MDRWLEKKSEAKERQEYWENLTPIEQLSNLNKRLGNGIGATKQRLKIKTKLIPTQTKFQENGSKQYTDPKKQRHQRRKAKSKKRPFSQN
jgi:hypothetical protein